MTNDCGLYRPFKEYCEITCCKVCIHNKECAFIPVKCRIQPVKETGTMGQIGQKKDINETKETKETKDAKSTGGVSPDQYTPYTTGGGITYINTGNQPDIVRWWIC